MKNRIKKEAAAEAVISSGSIRNGSSSRHYSNIVAQGYLLPLKDASDFHHSWFGRN